MSHIADLAALGWLPLQHYDDEQDVATRRVVFAVRLTRTSDDHPGAYRRVDRTAGDFGGSVCFQSHPRTRGGALWGFAVPCVVRPRGEVTLNAPGDIIAAGERLGEEVLHDAADPGAILAVVPAAGVSGDRHGADSRFPALGAFLPRWASRPPVGAPVLVAGAANERAQDPIAFPAFHGLVAPSLRFGTVVRAQGDADDFATRALDLTDALESDPDRTAAVTTLLRVARHAGFALGGRPLAEGTTRALALTLERGGLVQDGTGRLGALAGVLGGPLTLGDPSGAEAHRLGVDDDGRLVVPVHLATSTLFEGITPTPGPGGDGPLDFAAGTPPERRAFPHAAPVHLQFDGERWIWWAETPLYVPDSPPFGPDGPVPGGPGAPEGPGIPGGPGAPGGEGAPGGGGEVGGPRPEDPLPPGTGPQGFPPSGGQDTPLPSPPGEGGIEPPPFEPPPGGFHPGPFGPHGGFFPLPEPEERPPLAPTVWRPEWGPQPLVALTQELAFPALLLRPSVPGLPDLRYQARVRVEDRRLFDRLAPIVGRLEAVAASRDRTQLPGVGRYPGGTAPGVLALLPAELGVDDLDSLGGTPPGVTPSAVALAVLGTSARFAAAAGLDRKAGGTVTGYDWGIPSNGLGQLSFRSRDSAGAATERLVLGSSDDEDATLTVKPSSAAQTGDVVDFKLADGSSGFVLDPQTGKVTMPGLLDPSGVALTPRAARPTGSIQGTLWVKSTDGRLYYYDGSADQLIPYNAATAGRYLGTTVKTSGTSFTTGAGTNTIRVRVQAGGGGGGGIAGGTIGVSDAVGGGGAAGGYAEKTFAVSPSTAYTYAIGAAGAAGASGGGAGGAGGDSTFTVGAVTVTAKGGPGGAFIAPAGTGAAAGGTAPAQSTNGDVNGSGSPGGAGFIALSGSVGYGGVGADSQFGGGGASPVSDAAGKAGTGYGAGGSGACDSSGNTSRAGGAGTQGIIVIEEFS